jgi:hypothetical protein
LIEWQTAGMIASKRNNVLPLRYMKLTGLLLLCFLALNGMAQSSKKPKENQSQNPSATKADGEKLLRHVVLIKFKEGSGPEEVRKVEQAFVGLKKKIKQVKDIEWGINNSPENLNQELTHCFFLTFKDEKDRDDYLVHPDHKVFVDLASPHIDKVTVVDYWVKR